MKGIIKISLLLINMFYLNICIAGEVVTGTINGYVVWDGGNVQVMLADYPNVQFPAIGCGNRDRALIDVSSEHADELVATVMLAYVNANRVKISVSGCAPFVPNGANKAPKISWILMM